MVPATDLPLTLLVARRERPPGWEQAVITVYQPWIMASPFGRMIVTPDSGHYIQNDQAELVVDSIRRTAFPDAVSVLLRAISQQGVEAAMQRYREMKQHYPPDLLTERTLNSLGYAQLYNHGASSAGVKNTTNAIRIFSVNAEQYPKSSVRSFKVPRVSERVAAIKRAPWPRSLKAVLKYRPKFELLIEPVVIDIAAERAFDMLAVKDDAERELWTSRRSRLICFGRFVCGVLFPAFFAGTALFASASRV